MTGSTTINHTYAIRYAKAGFPVFPCCWPDPTKDYACGCGRGHKGRDIGKVPLTKNGLKDATTNIELIDRWWTRHPVSNVGLAIPDGYFVLDVDIEHSGYESLEKLQEITVELPKTLLITTGSGGSHYWYKTDVPIRNTARLAGLDGLDIRGIGGYVIAPPSMHRSGEQYMKSPVWPGPITKAPKELINLCTQKQSQVQPYSNNDTLKGIFTEGSRNQSLASLAGSLRAKGLPESTIEISLLEVNRTQCQPPLSDTEVKRIAQSYGRYPAGSTQSTSGWKREGLII
ncbi:MAG: bifunctional DNA primase/polymerase [Dehalococcoidales bacterium]|nr:bifunctional DNA primase/polymerase [Dehalococcoidales bacterium]